jgi:hypothetical protein
MPYRHTQGVELYIFSTTTLDEVDHRMSATDLNSFVVRNVNTVQKTGVFFFVDLTLVICEHAIHGVTVS